eukprot:GHVQ01032979.1.p1 GENE.GHVQ01032979.1~~GHVQ01032979.1.p1  ORF type:complete len:1050 (+),score=215.87 GHVQ01032979.1:90-3152(+)
MTGLFEQISGSEQLAPAYDEVESEVSRIQNEARVAFHRMRIMKTELKELEAQVAETDIYKRDQTALQALQVEVYLVRLLSNDRQFFVLSDQREHYARKLAKANQALDDLRNESQEAERTKVRRQMEHKEFEEGLDQLRQELEAMKPSIEEQRSVLSHATEQLATFGTRRDKLKNETSLRASYKREIEIEVTRVTNETKQLREAVNLALEQSVNMSEEQQQRYDKLDLKSRSTTASHRDRLDLLNMQKKDAANALQEANTRLEEVSRRHGEADKSLKEMEGKTTEAKAMYQATTEALQKKTQLRDDINLKLQTAVDGRATLLEKQTELNEKLSRSASTLQDVKRSQKRRDVINDMKQRIGVGVFGLVTDLCMPNSRRLGRAVQMALGREAEFIVVDTHQTAMRCIEYLKKSNLDRMEFMPLETRKGHPQNASLSNMCPFCVPVLHCIQYEAQFRALFEEVFKETVVVKTLEEGQDLAYNIAPRHGLRLKIVTEDGERFNKNASLTINTETAGPATAFDHREHQQLTEELQQTDQKLRELAEIESHGSRQLTELEESSSRLTRTSTVQQQRVTSFTSAMERLASAAAELSSDLIEARDNLKTTEKSLLAVKHSCCQEEEDIEEREREIFRELSQELGVEDVRTAASKIKAAREKQRAEEAKMKAKLEKLKEDLASVTTELADNSKSQRLDQQEQHYMEMKEKSQGAVSELSTQFSELQHRETSVQENEKAHRLRKNEIEELIERLKKDAVQLEEIRNECMVKEGNARNGLLENAETVRRTVASAILEGIEIPLRSGTQEALRLVSEGKDTGVDEDPEICFDSLSDEVKERISGTSNLGQALREEEARYDDLLAKSRADMEKRTPNLRAPEQFAELKQRFQETQQFCIQVKNKSIATELRFREVVRRRRRLFLACFNHVREAIDKIYPLMTRQSEEENSGGQAFLELDDTDAVGADERPFLCGVQYTVMPPSKRFREIALLSGGEKTMASLALLFALQSFYPSPFFVLDEVDAALGMFGTLTS